MASNSNFFRKFIGFIGISLLAWAIGSTLLMSRDVEEIEARTWDWRLRLLAHRSVADPHVKIINISQSSLDYYDREEQLVWPWPRSLYGQVIQFLQRGGAKGVAFDILFTEPSRFGVEDDAEFAQSVRGTMPVVIAGALLNSSLTIPPREAELFTKKQKTEDGRTRFCERFLKSEFIPTFNYAALPVPELLESAAALGNVSAEQDTDGVYRHFKPGAYLPNTPLLALPFALYDVVNGRSGCPDISEFLDERGRLTARFYGPGGTFPTFAIERVIFSNIQIERGRTPPLNPQIFRDAYVFVGMDAPGLLDLRPTPLSASFPGVEYNATILDNLIQSNFIKKVPFLWVSLVCLAVALLISAAILFPPSALLRGLMVACVVLGFIYACFETAFSGYWLPMFVPLVAQLIAILGALELQYALEGRQHKFIKNAFKFYVSPSVIDKIVADPSTLSLGGDKRELTIFFSDIQGFTSISEKLEATALVQLLNDFLTAMTDIILSYGGTVDKYVGDAIVAFWNAPVPVEDHAHRAVLASLACQAKLGDMRGHFIKNYGVEVKMRIGLNTGVVSVGNFGSKERFNYTIVGDAANLASRLEGSNKYFGTYLLLTQTTCAALNGLIKCRKVADIKVVGKEIPVGVYAPLGAEKEISAADFEIFEQGLAFFEARDFTSAKKSFATLPHDPVAKAYLTRIAKEEGESPEEFSVVWNLTEK